MEKILYEVEVELSLTKRELYRTVTKMLRNRKIFLALILVLSFALNNSRIPLYECFNDKEIKEFVNSFKGKTVKSITFCKPRDPCSKIIYNLQAIN